MRTFPIVAAVVLVGAILGFSQAAVPRGGGGRIGGGGGMPHRPSAPPAAARPNIQRPSAPISRPSAPLARPSAPSARPQMPSAPNLGANRPNFPSGINRPTPPAGGINRPTTLPGNITRPGGGMPQPPALSGGNRPTPPSLGGNRPTTLPGNITRPGGGSPQPPVIGGNRPTTLPGNITRPGGGGSPQLPGIGGKDRPGIGIGGGTRPPVIGGDRPGWPNLPGGGDRPGIGGGTRPPVIGGDRPGWPNLPGGGDRPGIGGGTRPPVIGGGGDRPNWTDRPGIGNRPGIGDRPVIGGGNNNNNGNRWSNINWNNNQWTNNNIQNNININNRHTWGGNWNGGYRPPYYRGWYHGGWNWNGPGWWGATGGFTAGWLLGSTTSTFVNPYYIAPAVGTTVVYDYSQPVPIFVDASSPTTVIVQPAEAPVASPVIPTAPPEQAPPPEDLDPKVKEAGTRFDSAREKFAAGKYADALVSIDEAIKILPKDAALHEFRSLTLFAQKRYTESASVIYSVLAVGPGWTWETVKSFYTDWHTYEQQLKDLKAFVEANPKDAASRFLLAYHFLVLDERQKAVDQLNRVVQLNPEDQLAAAMSQAITQSLAPPPANDRPTIAP